MTVMKYVPMRNPVGNVSYWLPPNEEIIPSMGCTSTGRVATFHQLPKREWSCPNEYPQLAMHPMYKMHQWWNPGGMGSPNSAAITEQIRAMAPGIGASGWIGTILGVVGLTAGLGGLAYWLMKRQKNPSSVRQTILLTGLGSKARSTGEIYSRVKDSHPGVTPSEVARTLEKLAREGVVQQAARSGSSGTWKRSPAFLAGW